MGVTSENPASIREAQRVLRDRLTGRALPPRIFGYDHQRRYLFLDNNQKLIKDKLCNDILQPKRR